MTTHENRARTRLNVEIGDLNATLPLAHGAGPVDRQKPVKPVHSVLIL